jgi:hypothetical protein
VTEPNWNEEAEGARIVNLALEALTDARTEAMKSNSVFVEVRGNQLVRVQHGNVIGVVRDLDPRSTSAARKVAKARIR